MEYYPFNIRFYELKLNRTGNTIKCLTRQSKLLPKIHNDSTKAVPDVQIVTEKAGSLGNIVWQPRFHLM